VITQLFKRNRPDLPACIPCNGRGKVRGPCAHCEGGGVMRTRNNETWYWCPKCSNGRCLSCGGTGHPVNAVPEVQDGEASTEDIPPDTRT